MSEASKPTNRGCIPHAYCRWLASFFFVSGMDREDLYQEACLAAWLADPGFERRKARQRVLDLVKIGQRRRFDHLVTHEPSAPPVDFEARDRLRLILNAPRTENERVALRRRIAGEPIYEKAVWMAWARMRDRVAA